MITRGVREFVQEKYAGKGRPSIDPLVFFKLQLVMFFEDIRSERLLMRHAADRLSVRWYLGYDLDEPLPDHSGLTRIRDRYGVEVFRRFFEKIMELCQAAGLVWGKEVYFEGTKVAANAGKESLTQRFAYEAHLHHLFGAATEEEGEHSEQSGLVEHPEEGQAGQQEGLPIPCSTTHFAFAGRARTACRAQRRASRLGGGARSAKSQRHKPQLSAHGGLLCEYH